MAIETDKQTEQEDAASQSGADEAAVRSAGLAAAGVAPIDAVHASAEPPRMIAAPSQFGTQRFVYAGYFALGMAVAFIADKAGAGIWYKLQTWQPAVGEPRDEVLVPIAFCLGLGVALYCFRQPRIRELAEEVAAEMAAVTWPQRKEITDGTTVVIATTLIATVFFALMDRFWLFLTNLVYGT